MLPAAPCADGDAQLRGFLNEMKKIPDMPADAHTIIQKYAKKQRSSTTKSMHQSVTDLSDAREALDQARLARHQLHGSWRTFLGEALETWQAYTEGFKQQETELLARIEDAKQNLNAAKEVFEECRTTLIDLSKNDQQLIESAEAAMATEQGDDPAVARLQMDLDSMHGHLETLKGSADALAVDSTSAKRPRLSEPSDLTNDAEDGEPSKPGPLEPFGSARK
jgi:chromosome segregation ATPase